MDRNVSQVQHVDVLVLPETNLILVASVIEPLRESPVLGSTTKVTEPAPDPDEPAVIRIQEALGDAFQEQPLLVITLNIPVPPELGKEPLVGLIV